MDLDEQYDKIYRYCYFKVHSRELAEDITQETFLRFLGNKTYSESGKSLRYLYTIARNLCTDEYRRAGIICEQQLSDETGKDASESDKEAAEGVSKGHEEAVINKIVLKQALESLSYEDREMVILRYVNEVPLGTISGIFGISRFALHRRLNKALESMKQSIEGRKQK